MKPDSKPTEAQIERLAKALALAIIMILLALLAIGIAFAGWLGVAGWLVFTALFFLWIGWDTYQKSKKGSK